ncbi:hypothetical protein TWF718_010815 [Orbilia javanica]|uniref:Nephrocystin 3-like N-terminal domain-containing protein n=1 Tax=Orbilia javanica TaxID=47235 RepID=A0AAN8MGD2_9PEZI
MEHQIGPSDYKIGWICALPLEFTAAIAVLEATHPDLPRNESDTNAYKFGRVGHYNIIVAGLPSGVYGLCSATTVATNLRRSFPSVANCLVVGIGGGAPLLPKNDIRLGDVVVSHPTPGHGGVIQYDYGKTVQSGKFEQTGVVNKPPDIFLAAITKLKSEYPPLGTKCLGHAVSHVLESGRVPRSFFPPEAMGDCDKLFKESYDHPPDHEACDFCDPEMVVDRVHRPSNGPEIHYGLIASANQVMKHGLTRDRLSKEKNILCFEMEAAGVMNSLPSLVIRGICDYSDSHKNKRWQLYAALVAAVYARELLLQLGPPPASKKRKGRDVGSVETKDIFECLEALGGTNPADDKIRIEQSKDKLIEGSYYWLLNDYNFHKWLLTAERPILRISGDPGKGKTMIMIGMVDYLSGIFDQQTGTRVAMSYFFCQATDDRLNNATSVLKGIISQLVSDPRYPSLARHIKSEIDIRGKSCFTGTNSILTLQRLLLKICADPQYDIFCFMIDALDECTGDLEKLLQLICSTSAETRKIRWFTTSRNNPEIESSFEYAGSQLQISLELNNENVGATIQAYIEYKMLELSTKKRYSKEIQETVGMILREKAGGTFLWAHLACKELEKVYSYNAVETLNRLPRGLAEFYKGMLESIRDTDYGDVNTSSQILSAAVVAFRPLSLREMVTVAGLSPATEEHDIEVQIKKCGSFLATQNNTIFFVHQSAKDFLVSQIGSALIMASGLGSQHRQIVDRCLQQLQGELKMDICGLNDPGFQIRELKDHQRDSVIHLRYACYYWVNHLASVEPPTSESEVVLRFLEKNLLHWMELMVVLDPTFRIVSLVKDLERIMESTPNKKLKLLLYDLKRFSQYHQAAISEAPLQLYSSLLAFSPWDSVIRSLFRAIIPKWLPGALSSLGTWGSLVRIFEGQSSIHQQRIRRASLSGNGQMLANATYDGRVDLWDISSGSLLFCLTPPETGRVESLQFSPDNRLLSIVTAHGWHKPKSVRIWNTASGENSYTWDVPGGYEYQPSCVWAGSAFKLIYACNPTSLLVLHINGAAGSHTTAEPFAPAKIDSNVFNGVFGLPRVSLACNSLGDCVASTSGDGNIPCVLLWDAPSRSFLRAIDFAFKSGPTEVTMCFSPRNELLVATKDMLYRLNHDRDSKEDTFPLESELVPQFLNNGSRIVSFAERQDGKPGAHLKFYDVHSGRCLQSLVLDDGSLEMEEPVLMFLNSNATQWFSSFWNSQNVYMYDISTEGDKEINDDVMQHGEEKNENEKQERRTQLPGLYPLFSNPDNIAVSPEGRYVATCHWGSIVLWDQDPFLRVVFLCRITEDALQDVGASEPVLRDLNYLGFSPESEFLIYVLGGYIKVWDICSRFLLCSLRVRDYFWTPMKEGATDPGGASEASAAKSTTRNGVDETAVSILSADISTTGKIAILLSSAEVQVRSFNPPAAPEQSCLLARFMTKDIPKPFTDLLDDGDLYTLKFSSNGLLLMVTENSKSELWDLTDCRCLMEFDREEKPGFAAYCQPAFSQNSQIIALPYYSLGGEEFWYTIQVWNTASRVASRFADIDIGLTRNSTDLRSTPFTIDSRYVVGYGIEDGDFSISRQGMK